MKKEMIKYWKNLAIFFIASVIVKVVFAIKWVLTDATNFTMITDIIFMIVFAMCIIIYAIANVKRGR